MTTILKVMGIIIGGFFIISLGSCMLIGVNAGIEHNNRVEKCVKNVLKYELHVPEYARKYCEDLVWNKTLKGHYR